MSRGLGDVYKRQMSKSNKWAYAAISVCLLYTSDAADEARSVDLGGRRIIKKTTHRWITTGR
ncbi:hypothetical protein JMUB7533_26800 [Staphylococcus aureus]